MKHLEARLQLHDFQDAGMFEFSSSALQSENPKVRLAVLEAMCWGTEVAFEILLQHSTTEEAGELLKELKEDGVFQDLAEQHVKDICEEAQAFEELLPQSQL